MPNAITLIHMGLVGGATNVIGWPSCLDDGDPGTWIMQTFDEWEACAPTVEWDSGLPHDADPAELADWAAGLLGGPVRLEYGRHLVQPRGWHLPRLEPVYLVIPER